MMKIFTEKIKILKIAKEPIQCKLNTDKIIEKIMEYKRYIQKEGKVRICKSLIRAIFSVHNETRTDTTARNNRNENTVKKRDSRTDSQMTK